MKLPTHAACLTLLDTYRTPYHVVQHCFVVNRVGMFLARKLVKQGVPVDLDVVDRATVLHDMLRVVNFLEFDPQHFTQSITKEDLATWRAQKEKYKDDHHATAARKELTTLGYGKLGKIIEAHRADAIRGGRIKLNTIEKKILYYADKRVSHTDIVSIPERFNEWKNRHRWGADKLREMHEDQLKVLALEKELMEIARMRPSAIQALQDR